MSVALSDPDFIEYIHEQELLHKKQCRTLLTAVH